MLKRRYFLLIVVMLLLSVSSMTVCADFRIILNFDDGYRGVYQNAFPMMRQRDLPGVLFVSTGFVNREKNLTRKQLVELKEAGWEIGSHTVHHYNLEELTPEYLQREIVESKQFLLKAGLIGPGYASFASPLTAWNEEVEKVVEKHYHVARNSHLLFFPKKREVKSMARVILKSTKLAQVKIWISEAKQLNLPLILIFHEIADGGNIYFFPPVIFEQLLDLIKVYPVITFYDLYQTNY